jgi:hypothetical protein
MEFEVIPLRSSNREVVVFGSVSSLHGLILVVFLTPLPFVRSLNAVKHCSIELGVENVEIPVLHHLLIPIFLVYLNL